MLSLAFAIGIFSYCIFFIGLAGFLYKPLLILCTILFWGGFFLWKKELVGTLFQKIKTIHHSPLIFFSLIYLLIQVVINFVGLLGPEIGFDATWYHLTLPKLYLLYHTVIHIPGGILYYSDMPHLTEMLYTVGLSFGSDFFARGVHFLFGLLDCVALYLLGRKFLSKNWAILLSVLFYSNLVVGWESISGYIDLSRTFFTIVSLLAFFTWIQKKDNKYLFFTGLFVGLTISTKLLALPDVVIYTIVLLFYRVKKIGVFLFATLLPCLPWFVFAYIHTGDPIFPMLSSSYPVGNYWQILNPFFLVQSFWETFVYGSDPINPFFIACLPLLILFGKKLWKEVPLVVEFALGGVVAWYITPQTGGGRYILPYLPMLSLLCLLSVQYLTKKLQWLVISFIFIVALLSLIYRGAAVAKFVPLLMGRESEAHFMTTHLQYNLGDFYDIDGYFAKHITPSDRVLLYGFHNLYYVNFPFIDSEWVKRGDTFNYLAVQGNGMPKQFPYGTLVYFNATTRVRLYKFKEWQWYY